MRFNVYELRSKAECSNEGTGADLIGGTGTPQYGNEIALPLCAAFEQTICSTDSELECLGQTGEHVSRPEVVP